MVLNQFTNVHYNVMAKLDTDFHGALARLKCNVIDPRVTPESFSATPAGSDRMMQLKLFAFDAEAPIRTKPLFGGRTSAGNRSKGKHLDLQTILKAKGFKLPYLSTVCALGEIITPPMLAAPIAIADPYFEDRYLVISIDRATLNRRLDLKWWDNVAPKHHHFFGLR